MINKQILFVDDDAYVLAAQQNLMRRRCPQWSTSFVLGGEQALDELAQSPFDVVVTDMRMPGMDGAELLAVVKERHPRVARIILSGQADEDAVNRALPVAQQFLSKPCDFRLLQSVVERACTVRDLLEDPKIRDIAGRIDKLPATPGSYWELCAAAARSHPDPAAVARIIERDPAMCAKVLQLASSAYFGHAAKVISPATAVSHLGIDLLKGLALTSQLFALAEDARLGPWLEELQWHSFVAALLARQIATSPEAMEAAFTAGLVHDVGKIVLAMGAPDDFAAVTAEAAESGRPVHVVEKQRLGVSHGEIGAYLMGMWGLPLAVIEAVAWHHTPAAIDPVAPEVLAAVHVAEAVLDAARSGGELHVDRTSLARAGVAFEPARWLALAERERSRRSWQGES